MMNVVENLKMAVTMLLVNKFRSSLTMLGIIIGNASVIALVGIGQGAQKLAAEKFEALGANVLFVGPGSRNARKTINQPKTMVLADAEAIASQVPSVNKVAPEIDSRDLVNYGNKSTNSLISGVTPEFLSVRGFQIAQGRFLTPLDLQRNDRVVILGSDLAEKLFADRSPLGQLVRLKSVSFVVIGVMQSKGSFLGNNLDNTAFVPLTTMANRLIGRTSPYGTELSFLIVTANNGDSMDAAKFQITNLLRLRHKITTEDDFFVDSQKDLLETVGTVTGALTILLAAIAGISLLVGGIGIMNIMLFSVSERTPEIGLRKALGASGQDILIQFMFETLILSATGGLIGTFFGISGVILVGLFTPLNAGVSPIAIILTVGISGGIGLFFGIAPAKQAAKLDPIVALKSV